MRDIAGGRPSPWRTDGWFAVCLSACHPAISSSVAGLRSAVHGPRTLGGCKHHDGGQDTEVDAAPPADACEGLGGSIVHCGVPPPTRVSGTVYAPSGTLPLYGVTVYVPIHDPGPLTAGVLRSRASIADRRDRHAGHAVHDSARRARRQPVRQGRVLRHARVVGLELDVGHGLPGWALDHATHPQEKALAFIFFDISSCVGALFSLLATVLRNTEFLVRLPTQGSDDMARGCRGFLRWYHRTSSLNEAVPSGLAVLPAVQTGRAADAGSTGASNESATIARSASGDELGWGGCWTRTARSRR